MGRYRHCLLEFVLPKSTLTSVTASGLITLISTVSLGMSSGAIACRASIFIGDSFLGGVRFVNLTGRAFVMLSIMASETV